MTEGRFADKGHFKSGVTYHLIQSKLFLNPYIYE
jgi:hypothetical protein